MAQKITDLIPGSLPLSGGELIEIVQNAASYSVPVSGIDHNTLSTLQGGIVSAGEYYHLSQSIHDGLFSESPTIGIGNSTTKIVADYGNNVAEIWSQNVRMYWSNQEEVKLGDMDGDATVTYIHVNADNSLIDFFVHTAGNVLHVDTDGITLSSGVAVDAFSNDSLAASGSTVVPTQSAVKDYVDESILPVWLPSAASPSAAIPGLICPTEVTLTLSDDGSGTDAKAVISAADLIISIIDTGSTVPSGGAPYTYGLEPVGNAPDITYTDPRDAYLVFDCSDAPSVTVEVGVCDQRGFNAFGAPPIHYNIATVTVNIEDFHVTCP